jgi:hypothetical protein
MTDANGAPPPAPSLPVPIGPGAPPGVSEKSLALARVNFLRQFKASEAATTQEAVDAEKATWAARFDDAVSGKAAPMAAPEIERAFHSLVAMGMSPAAAAEVRTAKGASQIEHDFARTWRTQFGNDKARVAKYMDGDAELRKQFLAANFILSLPVIQKGGGG